MSRTGQVWRGDLAQHIEDYLAGHLTAEGLQDWAMDHPFFEDRSLLDAQDQAVIAHALGRILQLGDREPEDTRTTREQLLETVEVLWQRSPFPS